MPTDQYIKTASGKLRYWEAGEASATPVILIPGLGGYLELWKDNIHALAQHFHVFAIEPIGFGKSDKPVMQYTLGKIELSIIEFIIERDIKKAHIIGNSLGGALALQVATKHPEHADKIVLVGSAGLGRKVTVALRIPSLPIVGELLFRSKRSAIEKNFQMIVHDSHCITKDLIDTALSMNKVPGQKRVVLNIIRNHINLSGIKKSVFKAEFPKISSIQHPTLLIVGENDRVIPASESINAQKHLPNSMLKILRNCGHLPQLEYPDTFNQAVIEFLNVDSSPDKGV